MTKALFGIAAVCATLAASGCGVTYTSPSVGEQAAGAEVRVMPLTAQTVLMANRQSYTPRSLPAVFSQIAGGGSLRGAGALPEQPYLPTERREAMELRIPPDPISEPYRIGVGDVLLLATKSSGSTVEELSGLLAAQNQRQGYTVRDDGAIAIPEIGQVQLAGMTLEEAEARLFQVLVENQIDPAFSLEILEFNSKRVAVGGSVGNSTLVPITLNTLNLGEALTAAGGLSVDNEEFALIRIYRDGGLYQIPIEDFFSRPELQRLRLQNGDAIYVDTSYDLDRALSFYRQQLDVISLRRSARTDAINELQAEIGLRRAALNEQRENFNSRAALGAEQRDYVYLAGEVNAQSRFVLPYNQHATLADVLYENGGFNTTTGNPAEIYVLRASSNPAEFGAVTAWHLNAANAANITLATRMQMRPNDIVFIEEQPITKWNRALQQAFPTLINTAARAAAN
ncbi:polysaccharide biosynthesis/export family protein [Aestuariicoccus sp. MJ-SS9]|uniref:polysaccharide biosynthesis/export family protein n=1 Tax=Aestuariicoccus sp. MJ-SS9 TaxID=3079855 RepID=UPI00290DAB9F|nr:polysaccharide biosynthesis/export family protein [Aestuariicoccus sp. MJ-SS9]MDU8914011.1 polysaccharide biosynthesis/export family protein [Aestuariicoccus sp. MJ-SS9]